MEEQDVQQDGVEADDPLLRAALEDAERRALASHKQLEEIQSLTKVGSWEWELSSQRSSWSDELRRIAGLGPEEPVPTFEEFIDHIHPEDRPGFLADMQRAFEEGGVRHYTYRIVLRDGTEKLIESHAQVETDEAGAPVRVFGAAQDVTDRWRAETSLKLQADLLDQVEVAVMASDTNRRLTQWNRAAEKLLGISRSGALERTIDEVMRIPPSSAQQRRTMVKRLGAGEKWEGELTLYNAEGQEFPAYATNAPVRDKDGQIVGYSGVVMDLSEMKEAHAELSRRAEEQEAIAALSREAMAGDEMGALLERAARLTTEVLGVASAEVLELKSDGLGLELRASSGQRQSSGEAGGEAQAAYTLAAGKPIVVEDYDEEQRFPVEQWQIEAKTGATVVIEGGDHAYGVLGAFGAGERELSTDAIHFMESVANVLAAAMARQRAQRLESQLHQNQRLEAVGQLAGGVAHDFNNLLVVILNYADFLADQIEDGSLKEDLSEIRTAAERAAGLTHQLLVFSRREVVLPEAVDLNAVVRDTEDLLRRSLREHIDLVHNCGKDLWPVRLGSGQAEQILVNLLVNARDAMPEGGAVEIKTENLELGPDHGKRDSLEVGKFVRLTVADSGIGMDSEVEAQAFDPFFTTRKDEGGTGLGLATVYGIVKEAGGHIDIYTEPGQGTAFKIYLPAADAEPVSSDEDPREIAPADGETILLVEDEASVRRLAERILVEHGYRVITALDGKDAQAAATRHGDRIDLLLTDVVMPHLSGPQLARELRQARPEMQALFMSGYTGEVISRHGIVEEGVALVEKPFDSKGLLYAVSTALHAEQPERSD